MPLSDILKGDVVSCSEDTSIHDVADLMKNKNVGAVLVLKDDKPVGICTDRDIVMRCISDNVPATDEVSKVMTKSVHTLHLGKGLQELIRLMRDKEIRRVCITNDEGRAIGLVSFGDIVGLLAKELGDISKNTAVNAA